MKSNASSSFIVAAMLGTVALAVPSAHAQLNDALRKEFLDIKAKAEKGDAEAQTQLGFYYATGRGVEKDEKEAIKWCHKAAERNFATAQYALGVFYLAGLGGVAQNEVEAVKWLRKSAEQNLGAAQSALGECYYKGQGVVKDYAEMVKWFLKAAAQNDAQGQLSLGDCYINGEGVEKNTAEAVKWYRKAAEQNDVMAQLRLGVCYADGQGVEKDYAEAYAWYNLLAARANPLMETAKIRRDNLEKKMAPQQVADAQKRTKELQAQIAAKMKGGSK